MRPDIYRVEVIGRGFLAVMARPVSGEWIEEEFKGIANEGISQIISLLEVHEEYELGLRNEKEFASMNGMEFVSFPIKDRGLPNSIKEYLEFRNGIYNQISKGKNTVIHCRAGIGRTGIIAAGILLHCGFEPKQAISQISSARGTQVPDTEEQIRWVESSYTELSNSA